MCVSYDFSGVLVLSPYHFRPIIIGRFLAGCVKVAVLRAMVFTIPSKRRGLRVQTTDIILGEPGVGKGTAFQ